MAATATEAESPTDVLETEEARNLIEAAQAAGRISAEEIALALDELELEPAQIEDVYRALEELQVEIVDAAAKLNDPGKGICGFVGRGLKNANVPVWTSFLLGYGGGFTLADERILLHGASGITAVDLGATRVLASIACPAPPEIVMGCPLPAGTVVNVRLSAPATIEVEKR